MVESVQMTVSIPTFSTINNEGDVHTVQKESSVTELIRNTQGLQKKLITVYIIESNYILR